MPRARRCRLGAAQVAARSRSARSSPAPRRSGASAVDAAHGTARSAGTRAGRWSARGRRSAPAAARSARGRAPQMRGRRRLDRRGELRAGSSAPRRNFESCNCSSCACCSRVLEASERDDLEGSPADHARAQHAARRVVLDDHLVGAERRLHRRQLDRAGVLQRRPFAVGGADAGQRVRDLVLERPRPRAAASRPAPAGRRSTRARRSRGSTSSAPRAAGAAAAPAPRCRRARGVNRCARKAIRSARLRDFACSMKVNAPVRLTRGPPASAMATTLS